MKKRFQAFFVMLIFLFTLAGCSEVKNKIDAVRFLMELSSQESAELMRAMEEGKEALSSGRYAEAPEPFKKALEIARKAKKRKMIGGIQTALAGAYSLTGEYNKGLTHSEEALAMCRDIGYRKGESANLTGIGMIYQYLGQYDKALTYCNKGLVIDRETGDRRGESASLSNIGMIYWYMGQYDKSLSFSENALEINRDIGEQSAVGRNLMNIGVAYLQMEQYDKSLTYLKNALEIHRRLGNQNEEAFTLANFGFIYEELGKYEKASESFQQSLMMGREAGIYELLWNSQRGLAKAESKLENYDNAILLYEQTLDTVESVRGNLTEKEDKLSFMQNKLEVYDELITLLKSLHQKHPKKGYDKKSVEIFERKQGRVFLEEMGQSGARNFAGIPDTVIQKENELNSEYIALQAQRAHEGSKKERDMKRIGNLERQMEAVRAEEQRFQETLRVRYPDYHALKYPKPATLKELRENVLQPGEVMLVYNVMEERTLLWLIGKKKKQFGLFPIDISEAELSDKIRDFRQGADDLADVIRSGRGGMRLRRTARRSMRQMTDAGHELHNLLIPKKVRPALGKAKTLYVIPTGELYSLPFEALVTRIDEGGKGHYLTELNKDISVAYLSSASLLKIIRDARDRKKEDAAYPLLAFANPVYGEAEVSEKKNPLKAIQADAYLKLMGSGRFQELPKTEDEVRKIMETLEAPENPPPLQLGSAASRSNVFDFNKKRMLDDFQYVIFACHGVLPGDSDRITQPALVLSHPDPVTQKDGYLTMGDVFGLRLNADLVTLSACKTGGGKRQKGEGVIGLTRAFMFAGTPAVSVTLWSVESKSAAELSTGMYENIRNGKTRAQALRDAKLRMIQGQNELYQNPFFWSPVVIFGDGR